MLYRSEMMQSIIKETALTEDDSEKLEQILDHMIMVMGNNVDDMIAWLNTEKFDLEDMPPVQYIAAEQDLTPIKQLLRNIMEQDSRIG